MTKAEVKRFADLFGKWLPIGAIKEADTRKEIVLLAASLRRYGNEIDAELETIRSKFVEGHEEEVDKWLAAVHKVKYEPNLSEEERQALRIEAEGYKEAIRINDECGKAQQVLLKEDMPEMDIHKVELTDIFSALDDAQFLSGGYSLDGLAKEFKAIIKN